MPKIAFIGAGKMATAIAKGLLDKGVCRREDITAADIVPAARAAFQAATGVACAETATTIVGTADVLVLAVKPQTAAAAIAPLVPALTHRPLIISIAAGLTLDKLGQWFGSDRIIRVMPNTPLMVGKGASGYAGGTGVSAADLALCGRIFGSLGVAHEVPEAQINAVTALSGSGPAYVFEMVQGLVDAAVTIGLPPELALDLTVQTLAGAAEMLAQKQGTPDELRIAVTSPGGTTAAGLAVFDNANFRGILQHVVSAAHNRAIELGK